MTASTPRRGSIADNFLWNFGVALVIALTWPLKGSEATQRAHSSSKAQRICLFDHGAKNMHETEDKPGSLWCPLHFRGFRIDSSLIWRKSTLLCTGTCEGFYMFLHWPLGHWETIIENDNLGEYPLWTVCASTKAEFHLSYLSLECFI